MEVLAKTIRDEGYYCISTSHQCKVTLHTHDIKTLSIRTNAYYGFDPIYRIVVVPNPGFSDDYYVDNGYRSHCKRCNKKDADKNDHKYCVEQHMLNYVKFFKSHYTKEIFEELRQLELNYGILVKG